MEMIFLIVVVALILYLLNRKAFKRYEDEKIKKRENEINQLNNIVKSKLPNSENNFYIERYNSDKNINLLPNERTFHVLTDNKKFRMSVVEKNEKLSLIKWIEVKD